MDLMDLAILGLILYLLAWATLAFFAGPARSFVLVNKNICRAIAWILTLLATILLFMAKRIHK